MLCPHIVDIWALDSVLSLLSILRTIISDDYTNTTLRFGPFEYNRQLMLYQIGPNLCVILNRFRFFSWSRPTKAERLGERWSSPLVSLTGMIVPRIMCSLHCELGTICGAAAIGWGQCFRAAIGACCVKFVLRIHIPPLLSQTFRGGPIHPDALSFLSISCWVWGRP